MCVASKRVLKCKSKLSWRKARNPLSCISRAVWFTLFASLYLSALCTLQPPHCLPAFSALSPERDNYRFRVLWEELGDCIRLDKAAISSDVENWSASRDTAKAAGRAAAEALAAHEAASESKAKSDSRTQSKAAAEAATEQLRHRLFSIEDVLEKTQNEMQSLRLKAAAVLSNVDVQPGIVCNAPASAK